MPELQYKESRVYRERDRDDSSSDEERRRTTTVRRYKVSSGRLDRGDDFDDDRFPRYSPTVARASGDLLDVSRDPASLPERSRSAFEPNHRSSPVTGGMYEREYERRDRERDPYEDRSRSYYYERDVERDRDPDHSRSTVVVEKSREFERDLPSARDWDRRSRAAWDDAEVRVERRVERREDGDVLVDRRVVEYDSEAPPHHRRHHHHHHDGDVERYRRETEYYSPVDPPPHAPIVVQSRPNDQKVIVHEAPAAPPIILPRQDPGIVVIREKRPEREVARRNDEHYYRRETREIGPYRHEERREWERRGHGRDYASDGGFSDDGYVVRRRHTVIRRERSSSSSSNDNALRLAGGAIAGAGVAALAASRPGKSGGLPEHRGRKVLAGAALGALGTEAFKRARSVYEDRFADHRDESPERGHERHSRIKTGLGIAAAALAVAGATQYYKAHKIEKEYNNRGRSRTRSYSNASSNYSASRSVSSRGRKRSRSRTFAKAAIATAATAGIIKKIRSRSRSKSQASKRSKSQSRSRSRLRAGAGLAAAGLAGGVASKLWNNHKEKKERERSRSLASGGAGDGDYDHRSRSRSRSNTRNHSRARTFPSDSQIGPVIQYGSSPQQPIAPYPDSERESDRPRRRRGHRGDRDRSMHSSDPDYSSADDKIREKKKRSRSRLRDYAAAAVGSGAAALGMKGYGKRRDQRRDPDHSSREPSRNGSRRQRDRQSYDGDYDDLSYDDPYPPSPPHASGGSYPPATHAPPGGFTGRNDAPSQHLSTPYPLYGDAPPPNTAAYPPYPPTPGYENGPGPAQEHSGYPPGGPPPAPGPGPDHVSDDRTRDRPPPRESYVPGVGDESSVRYKARGSGSTGSRDDPEHHIEGAKSVTFMPLPPRANRSPSRGRQEGSGERNNGSINHHADGEQSRGLGSYLDGNRQLARRGQSEPSTWNHPQRRHKRASSEGDGTPDSASESDVEDLPRRFDARGRPLHPGDNTDPRWTSRSTAFEFLPRDGQGWHVRGGVHAAGTDPEFVTGVVESVERALRAGGGWRDVLGTTVRGLIAGSPRRRDGEEWEADEYSDSRKQRRRR